MVEGGNIVNEKVRYTFLGTNEKVWQNRYTTLFWMNDPESLYPLYLGGISVFRIMWCGPDDHRMILKTYPNRTWWGFDFPEGAILELLLREPAQVPDVYHEDGRIMRFNDCKVKRQWMRRPKAIGSEETEHITLHIELSCVIEVFDEEEQ